MDIRDVTNPAFLGAAAAAVGVPLVLALFARLFPTKPAPASGRSAEYLTREYTKWERRAGFLYLAIAVPFGLLWWVLLIHLGSWVDQRLPAAEYTMTVGRLYWMLPAMALALVSAARPTELLLRRVLGVRYAEFMEYQSVKYRFDAIRVNRLVFGGCVLGCAVFIFLGFDFHVLVQSDRLIVNGYFSVVERVRPFDTIAEIKTARKLIALNGNTVHRREYVMTFRSGGTWSTNYLPDGFPGERKPQVMEYISRASGVPIREVEVLQHHEL